MEVAFFVLLGAVVLAAVVGEYVRRHRAAQALERLLARDPALEPTGTPLGLAPAALCSLFDGLPVGDRRNGVEHGVQGPLTTTVWDRHASLDGAAFRWWWEQRRHDQRHGRQYHRRATTAALVRLPAPVPDVIRIRPETVLGRLGLTRGGQQLESREFNRRFRVEAGDEQLVVMLLDAHVQRLLVEEFQGRGLELVGDLLLLTGPPAQRDGSLAGVVGELPAARDDAARIVAAIPGQVWRRLGVEPGASTAAAPRHDAASMPPPWQHDRGTTAWDWGLRRDG